MLQYRTDISAIFVNIWAMFVECRHLLLVIWHAFLISIDCSSFRSFRLMRSSPTDQHFQSHFFAENISMAMWISLRNNHSDWTKKRTTCSILKLNFKHQLLGILCYFLRLFPPIQTKFMFLLFGNKAANIGRGSWVRRLSLSIWAHFLGLIMWICVSGRAYFTCSIAYFTCSIFGTISYWLFF